MRFEPVYLLKLYRPDGERLYYFTTREARQDFLDELIAEMPELNYAIARCQYDDLKAPVKPDDPSYLKQRLVELMDARHRGADHDERQELLAAAFAIANTEDGDDAEDEEGNA